MVELKEPCRLSFTARGSKYSYREVGSIFTEHRSVLLWTAMRVCGLNTPINISYVANGI